MSEHFEVAIIGAGPAGLGAATNAAHHKLSHVLIEKREIGNTVFDYQLRKLVMAEPGKLPLRGFVPFQAGSREEVLAGWNDAIKGKTVNVHRGEVSAIKKSASGFEIHCGSLFCTARHVILCIGVQGTPRRLGVPGDDLPHVAYTLADPDAFKGKHILVVGAGDAAIENALGLCDQNTVSLLNRSDDFPRAKEANAAKILDAARAGKVKHLSNSEMARVEVGRVFVATQQGEISLPCDHIIARLGCILPRKFLEGCGINFPSADPAAVPVVNGKYESNVPGLYILGALIGYPLIKHAINQGFEVIEHIMGRQVEPADQVLVAERLQSLPGEVNANIKMIRQRLPLFAELSDAQFRELLIDSTIHQPTEGAIVFRRNDYTDTFYSIVGGTVTIEIPGTSQGLVLKQGEFFGEMGLISGRRRSANVKAGQGCLLLESPRKQLLKLMNSVQSVKRQLDQAFMLRALETSVFPGADPKVLAEVVTRAQQKNFKKGDVLFREGDPGDVLYVIRKGSVKVARRNRDGADVTQTYIPAGHVVGEMALLAEDVKPRSATVSAAVPCETIVLSKADFREILNKSVVVKQRVHELARARELENSRSGGDSQLGQLLDFMMTQGVTDADNFLLIDSDLCIACDNCEAACAATHHGYSRLDRKGGKSFASVQIPISCRHCENPLCMLDCPPDALTRMPNGEVVIRDCCIGCGNCVRNCPYGVIRMVYEQHEHGFSLLSLFGLGSKKKDKGPAKAGKCDMCGHLSGGPACVRSCPTGAAMRVNPSRMLKILTDKHQAGA